MDFGIFMEFEIRRGGDQASAFREGFDLVDAAEAWGLDGVWLGEMHFTPARSVLSAPIAVASAIPPAPSASAWAWRCRCSR